MWKVSETGEDFIFAGGIDTKKWTEPAVKK